VFCGNRLRSLRGCSGVILLYSVCTHMNWRTTEMHFEVPGSYCARAQPNHGRNAAANTSKQRNLNVFHSRLKRMRSMRRGVLRVNESSFTCYEFVRCELGQRLQETHLTARSRPAGARRGPANGGSFRFLGANDAGRIEPPVSRGGRQAPGQLDACPCASLGRR
jgi:hypothetical protein